MLLHPAGHLDQRIELASDAPPPLEAIGSPDMRAMWDFLNGPGYQVDLPAPHAAHPEISWTWFDT
ncbi:MAG: hypothetical protein JO100_08925 [Pseudonocardia sp.]|nr:hypothetical protein [Pseudonocardia sp.]